MIILMKNLKDVKKVFGFITMGKPTYITGTHYMYLQWSKIDVGQPDFRESNRLFFIFWEACKADDRCYGMCYLKNRRSGFSFMASGETVNLWQQYQADAQDLVYYQNQVLMLKKCLPTKLYQYRLIILSFSNRYKMVWIDLKQSLHTESQLLSLLEEVSNHNEKPEDLAGLDTTIDWKNTGDNAYDGEKLKLLVHDESGKWERPNNILNNWRVTKTL